MMWLMALPARPTRRSFLRTAVASGLLAPTLRANDGPANIVLILADDLGFGDVGCYGSHIPTPNLDRLAESGVRFTHFYSANPVCSPSRASLLTGRYATRMGLPGVMFPDHKGGIPSTEYTLPQLLQPAGYRTGMVGKWHLGDATGYQPNDKGFDEFFGVPWSNDMNPLPLRQNRQTIQEGPPQNLLTQTFTSQAVRFVEANKERPFFLYLSHTAPHIPLAPSSLFSGQSGLGHYGDSVMELDWSVGRVLSALRNNGLEENTIVLFTSDNGPWYQGSGGPLRGRKGSTFDGGMRVPFVARFPGRIPAGTVCTSMGTTMDLLPTLTRIAGAALPPNPLDGVDIWNQLAGDSAAPERDIFLFFDNNHIQCARMGQWKLHFARYNTPPWTEEPASGRWNLPLAQPELYDMVHDPAEAYDVAESNPKVVKAILDRVNAMLPSFPEPVQAAWRTTRNQQVLWSPTGGYPVRKGGG